MEFQKNRREEIIEEKNLGNFPYLKDMILQIEGHFECPGQLMKRDPHENTFHECVEC